MNRNLKQRGFTLIELLVVIAIIGVLAAIVLVSLNTARVRAREARRSADLASTAAALELYNDRFTAYPNYNAAATNTNFTDMVSLLRSQGYMGSSPRDPTNASPQVYRYLSIPAGVLGSGCSPVTVAYVMGLTFENQDNSTLDDNDGNCASYAAGAGTLGCGTGNDGVYCLYQGK